jgi:hypothetical protein
MAPFNFFASIFKWFNAVKVWVQMKTILQFKSINSFSTKRLIAEKLQASDLEKFRIMHTNEDVMKTLGGG